MKNKGFQLKLINGALEPEMQLTYDASGKIVGGWKLGNIQAQNEALILMSQPGEWKEHPTMGVGLGNALLSDVKDLSLFRREIRRCYKMDTLAIEKLDVYDIKSINIKARYE